MSSKETKPASKIRPYKRKEYENIDTPTIDESDKANTLIITEHSQSELK